jgi:hypothetical protein
MSFGTVYEDSRLSCWYYQEIRYLNSTGWGGGGVWRGAPGKFENEIS